MWIAVAFVCGFLARQIKLPPLVGYLAAGFGLHALGVEPGAFLEILTKLGVTLLLFTMGLKLHLKSLIKTEIWASATSHMGLIVVLTTVNSLVLSYFGLQYFSELNWLSAALIGFAVSFSSTVCVVKILEDKGEIQARHAQISIGILIVQDLAAVIFLSLATDKTPSWWALALLALPLARPMLTRLLQVCGHGELLPLAGIFLALTAGELFELVGLKAHLGALVLGALLSGHEKSAELSKSLLGFKDLFLIGFFLSIGFTALPTIDMLVAAMIMLVALPFKSALFYLLFTRLKLRSRTAFLSSLSLANYSEFGLIVCSASIGAGLLSREWLVIMALAMSLSFIFSSIINVKAHTLYSRWRLALQRMEHPERLVEDQFSQPSNATVLVIGMGRVGTGAYDALWQEQKEVCGLDVDAERVAVHCKEGRNAIVADAEDLEFWCHIDINSIQLIMLALPNHDDMLVVVKQIKLAGYRGKMAGVVRYEDEKSGLQEAGIDVVFNYYANAGAGLAEHSIHLIE
ncbi:potassium transporter Kef [Gammaproteobacteria bacterium 54_18_T64]|nr:potassium transporter Kef [Gammaproteobacteria bacterium 54_18_T64]